MKGFLLGSTLLMGLALAVAGCGGDDDDDGGGSGGCEHAKMVCASNPDVTIDCGSDWDSAPASIKDCAGKAATCDAVEACLLAGLSGSGG